MLAEFSAFEMAGWMLVFGVIGLIWKAKQAASSVNAGTVASLIAKFLTK
jgi:hypothetical protein